MAGDGQSIRESSQRGGESERGSLVQIELAIKGESVRVQN